MGAADNNILHDDVIIFDVAVVHYIQWRHSQWGPRGPDPTKISEADFKYFVQ